MANIWNRTSQVRRRGEKDWDETVGKTRAENENEAQLRIFGNNRKKKNKKKKKKKKKKKRKGYTMRSFVISVVLFAYFLCH